MKLNKWVCALVLALVLCMVGSVAMAATIKFDGTKTFQEVIDEAAAGDTILFTADGAGDGVVITKKLTINFDGHTYLFNRNAVGSTGTTTLAMQIKKSSEYVKLMNGTLKIDNSNHDADKPFKRVIQGYTNIDLVDMTIDGTNLLKANSGGDSAVTLNNGTCSITGNTSITASKVEGAYALTVSDYGDGGYTANADVTIDTTGTIGKIQTAGNEKDKTYTDKVTLTFEGGTFSAHIEDNTGATKDEYSIVVEAGTFLGDAAIAGSTESWTPWQNSDIDLLDSNGNLKGCVIGGSDELSAAIQEYIKAGDRIEVYGLRNRGVKLVNVPNGVTVMNWTGESISVNGQVVNPPEIVKDENGNNVIVEGTGSIVVGDSAGYSAPSSGDNSNVMLWAGLMLVSVLGMVMAAKKRVAER